MADSYSFHRTVPSLQRQRDTAEPVHYAHSDRARHSLLRRCAEVSHWEPYIEPFSAEGEHLALDCVAVRLLFRLRATVVPFSDS